MSGIPDTTKEARDFQLDVFRRMRPAQRAALALDATEFARRMVMADVRRCHPGSSADELHARFVERWLGPELARLALEHRSRRADAAEDGRPGS